MTSRVPSTCQALGWLSEAAAGSGLLEVSVCLTCCSAVVLAAKTKLLMWRPVLFLARKLHDITRPSCTSASPGASLIICGSMMALGDIELSRAIRPDLGPCAIRRVCNEITTGSCILGVHGSRGRAGGARAGDPRPGHCDVLRTNGGVAPNAFTFAIDGPQLTVRLADPLGGAANFDIAGASTEYYDVYYSDADGTFNLDGEYLSIEEVFLQTLPAGGGLNLAEIALNFASSPVEYGNFVASFRALGDNSVPGNVGRAIDGDLLTHTTMGNTVGSAEGLRVTLGFLSSSGPPPVVPVPGPGTLSLLGLGLAGLGFVRRRATA